MLAAFRPCLLVCGVVGLRTNAVASADDIDPTAIDEYVIARMQAARIPGLALAIVKDDQIVYLKGYGRADPSARPVTPQTPFVIGSVTKPFTALAVMQLVELGKLELDAPIKGYGSSA